MTKLEGARLCLWIVEERLPKKTLALPITRREVFSKTLSDKEEPGCIVAETGVSYYPKLQKGGRRLYLFDY